MTYLTKKEVLFCFLSDHSLFQWSKCLLSPTRKILLLFIKDKSATFDKGEGEGGEGGRGGKVEEGGGGSCAQCALSYRYRRAPI